MSLESCQWIGIGQSSHSVLLVIVYEWRKKTVRSQRCTVNAMNQLKKLLFVEYNLLYKKNLSFAAAFRRRTQNFTIIDEERLKLKQWRLPD